MVEGALSSTERYLGCPGLLLGVFLILLRPSPSATTDRTFSV